MKEIESLIPHRPPFLYVDEILEANDDKIIGIKDFRDHGDFLNLLDPNLKIIPGPIIVEALAQCGGAGVLKAGLVEFGIYAFATMDAVVFHKDVPSNQLVRLEIDNHRVGHKFIRQSGYAYINDEMYVEATWLCTRIS